MLKRWLDWFVRDRSTGRVVIGQWPNLPLWLFAAAWLVARLAEDATARRAVIASHLCLGVWAADELLRGVNPWRRSLGFGVLAWLAATTISL